MWGPTMWDILHTVAYISDSKHVFTGEQMTDFYRLIQPLLPCKWCRDSYGGFLEDALKAKNCQLGDACEKMQLGLLVYDVHERVNKKLLKQKFEKLKTAVMEKSQPESLIPQTVFDSMDEETVWMYMNSQPSQMILYKRGEFFINEPMKLDATWLLLLALSQRVTSTTAPNFDLFLFIVTKTLENLPFSNALLMARCISSKKKNSDLFDLYLHWVQEQCLESFDEKEFFKQTQYKLSLLMSSSCGGGTCK